MRRGRLARLARLGGMATGLVGDVAGAATHLAHESADEAAALLHRRAAKRLARVLGEMKGLPLKAGQMLSYIDEVAPDEYRYIYRDLLGSLQTHTPSMDWDQVQEIFAESYGGKSTFQVFKRFEPEPIAAASIGQVYRAQLDDGSQVAVKVQYPGVAEAVENDLANVGVLVSAISHLVPKTDFSHMVDDIAARVFEECDYEREMRNQRDFGAAWQGEPDVVIPRVYEELCTERVLVSEYIDAQEWPQMLAGASPELKCLYGRTIFRFVFRSLFWDGMFNGDPHPGNYLFYPDGRVAFIDFGCVQRYSRQQAQGFTDLARAALARTRGPEFRRMAERVFAMPPDLDPDMVSLMEEYLHLTFTPVTAPQPYRFDRAYSKQLFSHAMQLKQTMSLKMLRGKTAYPIDFKRSDGGVVFLGRIVFGLASILSTLGTEGDFRAILEDLDERHGQG